jgi:murein DD-endopeptidase MepM/ murein hydrolase activator NlpD
MEQEKPKRFEFMKGFILMMLFVSIPFIASHSLAKGALKTKPSFRVQEIILHQGGPKLFSFPLLANMSEVKLVCEEKEIPYYIKKGKVWSFFAVGYDHPATVFSCVYRTTTGDIPLARVRVWEKEFKKEFLKVQENKIVLSDKDLKRAKKEQEILGKVYDFTSLLPYFEQPFDLPVDARLSSPYGMQRIYNSGLKQSQHNGVDFRVPEGTIVKASNAGKVIFSGDLFFSGETVILDHGVGVFTIYCHMSQRAVKEMDSVVKGQTVGLSGKTGRVSGAHLHWGVKIHGVPVDGMDIARIPL